MPHFQQTMCSGRVAESIHIQALLRAALAHLLRALNALRQQRCAKAPPHRLRGTVAAPQLDLRMPRHLRGT